MSTVTVTDISHAANTSFGPWGNVWAAKYHFETNASGINSASDKTTAIGIADVVRLGILPAGLEIFDILGIVSDASTAAVTVDLGISYCDGVDVTATPQDAAYFTNDQAISSLAVFRKTGTKAPITLPKDAYLTMLNNTAAHDQACVIDIIVIGTFHGSPSAVPT
jgi:hypothetical protein